VSGATVAFLERKLGMRREEPEPEPDEEDDLEGDLLNIMLNFFSMMNLRPASPCS